MPLIRRLLLATLPLLPNASPADSAPAPAAVAPPPASVMAEPPSPPASGRLLWELDPYYSSLALQQPLTDHPLPDGGSLSEAEVYRRLFRDSLRPRLLLLEASEYPLPAAGTWFKHHDPDRYRDFNTGTLGSNQLNLIDAVTAGFQEPWALSAFTGSAMRFTRPDEPEVGRNRGYMGYLVSWGAKHIHNNVLIDDSWWELEWKLKGERRFHDQDLDWSFRLGVKNHGNPDISDVAYVGLRRSDLDYDSPWLSLLANSDLELLTELDRHSGRLLRQEVIVGRKLPLQRYHIALSLDVGVIYEDRSKYSGRLADATADSLTFVLRPHLHF